MMDDLDRRIRALDSRLDDLESEHQDLSSKFGYTDDLDRELRGIRDDISGCEEKINELDVVDDELRDRVNDIDRSVARLAQHVRLMEGQIRASNGAPVADLDTFTKAQRALARAMQRGWQAHSLLITDHQGYTYRYQIRRHGENAQQHREHQIAVIDAVGTLATTRFDSSARTQAAQQFREALTREHKLRQDLPEQASLAQKAEQALAADATSRAENQPVMDEGARAEQRLTLALRSRLADALSARAVLPTWFVTVLGSAPPAHGTEKWLDTATRVLLYRLTYDVTDQVLALGRKPPDTNQHRRQWYDQLAKDLRRW